MSKAGALKMVADYIERIGADLSGRGSRKVGEKFMELAEKPDTFQRGRKYALTREGLGEQFGVKFGGNYYGEPGYAYSILPTEDGAPATIRELGFDDLLADAAIPMLAHSLAPLADQLERGKRYLSADTLAFDAGTGVGKKVYPALYGDILNQGPDARNIVESFTPENQVRYLHNRSAALMRDPRAAKQLMMYPPLLEKTGLSFKQFMNLDPVEQLGVSQKLGALNTLGALKSNLKRAESSSHEMAPAFAEQLSYIPESLSSFTLVPEYERMAKNLRNSRDLGGLSALTPHQRPELYGPASLRRAGITLDTVLGKPVSSRAASGLEYKHGGALCHACSNTGR